jgi:hypothetical protein
VGLVGIENILNDTTMVRKIIDMTVFSTKIYLGTNLALFCILTQNNFASNESHPPAH